MQIPKTKDKLKDEVYVSESYLVGLLWNNPSLYSHYDESRLSVKSLGNGVWKFFLGLGRELFKRGVKVYDDISVQKLVNELNLESNYEKYGEYDTIEDIMEMVEGSEDNIESYYEEVKKYSLLRDLRNYLGDKVVEGTKKYDYKKLNRDEIQEYWTTKYDEIIRRNLDNRITEYNLLENLEEIPDKVQDESNLGMPFYNLDLFTDINNGIPKGNVFLFSAFSGMGKSSFVVYSLIMSCINHNKKLVIIANEMDILAYQKLLLITVMNSSIGDKLYEKYQYEFNRQNLERGNLDEEDIEMLNHAIEWITDTVDDQELIKFVPIEHYTMDSVEQTLRYYRNRGYEYAVIDTAKPSEGRGNNERWIQFVDDFERIYKLAKKDSLNMGIFCTVQNADSHLNMKYLDETCIGDAKKIKNTVDFCCHIRGVHDSELNGDDRLIIEREDGSKARLHPFKTYYLFFISKNRRGRTQKNGLPVLVMEVNLNQNKWTEVGWTKIEKDFAQ